MKKPMLSHDLLKQHEAKLSSLLSQPWLARELFISVRNDIEGLLGAIHHYIEYLQQCNMSMQQVHRKNEPQQTLDDNVVNLHFACLLC